MNFRALLLLLAMVSFVGCPATSDDDDTAANDDDAADDDDATGACDTFLTGDYDMTGDAWGMAMNATVTVDMAGCTFTFSNWNMGMDQPDGGTIDGADVTLNGPGAYWATCTGTITSDTEMGGTCADDGASWGMEPS